MRRRAALIVALIAGMVGASANAASAEPSYTFLHPGGPPTLTERLPVNVVFLGYRPNQVREAAFLSGLAKTYEPVVRSRLNYGQTKKVGITYTYDYHVSYGGKPYEDKFFKHLGRLAKPAPLTEYQKKYNAQRKNVRNVTSNALIDAPTVEKWLAYHPPAGVDTRRNTIFFINWYGRSDFKFHLYTKTDEPDPDTRYNFGKKRDSRKIIAWGGTTADDKQTGGRLPHATDLGIHGPRFPRPGGTDPRSVADHPLRGAEPADDHLAAVPGGAADPRATQVDQRRQQHVPGLAGRQRRGQIHQALGGRAEAVRTALA
jgi:hypothetical protein